MTKPRIAAAIITLAAALTITACGRSGGTPAITAPTPTYQATTTTVVTKYDAFLKSARSRFPGSSDTTLIQLGKATCDTIDTFGSVTEMFIAIAEDPKWSVSMAGDAAYMTGLAVPTFCPEYTAELQRIAKR